jgi:putative endonuclease
MRSSPARGRWAEERAERWLVERNGWRPVDRNVRLGGGEIDLILEDGDAVVFVEVKARREGEGPAVEAVTADKRRRLGRAAALWLARHGVPAGGCRFDLVTVEGPGDRARLRHLENAFPAEERWGI